MRLANQTRTDISNAMRAVARYCVSPRLIDSRTSFGILGCDKLTDAMGIIVRRDTLYDLGFQAYADADYESKATKRRSVLPGLVMCGGGCVSWFSRTQECVALSTSETEYVAMTDAVETSVAIHVA